MITHNCTSIALKERTGSLWFNDFVLSLQNSRLKMYNDSSNKIFKNNFKTVVEGENRNNAEIKQRNSFHYSHMDPFHTCSNAGRVFF